MSKINDSDRFAAFVIFIVGPGLWLMGGNWLAWPITVIVGLAYVVGTSTTTLQRQRRRVQDGETVRVLLFNEPQSGRVHGNNCQCDTCAPPM